MSNLYETIRTSTPEHLLADPMNGHPIAVPMEMGNGEIARGTLLYRKDNGLWAPAATSNISSSYAFAVLNEKVDTGVTADASAVAPVAAAYQTGRFIDGKVLYYNSSASEYQSVGAAQKQVLGLQGIFFDQSVESAVEFDNGAYAITYVANNGTTEANVVKAKLPGVSYTVLNNSDSSLNFTAPATKSFSKWNTKADGSGTDYAAAASYATDADLTLYAVWVS